MSSADVTRAFTAMHSDAAQLGAIEHGRLTTTENTSADLVVHTEPSARGQRMLGFGAALTQSAALALLALDEPLRDELLVELFAPDHLGLSVLRVPIGASDFATHAYTYADRRDPSLRSFSLAPDEGAVLPVLRQIADIAPEMHIVASPWSPPAWLKRPRHLEGRARARLWRMPLPWLRSTRLADAHYDTYARYLVRYVEAMADLGLPVHALTVQNEPGFAPRYPGMRMSVAQQGRFIGEHLGPMLAALGSPTQIWAHDHNWNSADHVLQLLDDPQARAFIDAVAWHGYNGEPQAQTRVHDAHPEIGTHFTEITSFADRQTMRTAPIIDDLHWHMRNVAIGATANWAQSVTYWNLALDETSGPRTGAHVAGFLRGVVTADHSTQQIGREVGYWSLAHLAPVRPGAQRVHSTATDLSDLHQVAFVNPDQSIVVLLASESHKPRQLELAIDGWHTQLDLPPRDVRTIVVSPPGAARHEVFTPAQ